MSFLPRIRLPAAFFLLFSIACSVAAQQTATSGQGGAAPAKSEALAAADEVLQQVSVITRLQLLSPLKKSFRTQQEIRAYVLKHMKEDKSQDERYAAERAAIAFGLVPRGFQMEPFMVDLLTEQIAGLYDPDDREFYIADWVPLEEQRMVMAHELTHALQDQHFHIEKWLKAARPNDDAELARDAVLEGSATAAMIDYLLQGLGKSLKDLPDFDPDLFTGALGETPTLQKAPPFIRDALMFPYFDGMKFCKALLARSGWEGLSGVFDHPPASTQQILHPELYFSGQLPERVQLSVSTGLLSGEWRQLDDNLLGEFGWREVLQVGLGKDRALALSAAWKGDRYIVFEEKASRKLVLVYRVRWSDADVAARFLGQYSEALEKKHSQRNNLFRRPGFFTFDAAEGIVALRCIAADCIVTEGGTLAFVNDVYARAGWTSAPERPKDWGKIPEKSAAIPVYFPLGYR